MKTWVRSGLTLTVLMIAVLFVLAVLSAGIGPLELIVWLAILVALWVLCWVGSRSGKSERTS